jgi:hypothetical protein
MVVKVLPCHLAVETDIRYGRSNQITVHCHHDTRGKPEHKAVALHLRQLAQLRNLNLSF